MNRPRALLVVVAALALLAADAHLLLGARANHSRPFGGSVELTERELHLPAAFADSTALTLHFHWTGRRPHDRAARFPDWLTSEKLAALGFDTHVPADAPAARRHYRAQPPADAWLVLEHRPATATHPEPTEPKEPTLVPIDAGPEPSALRHQYSDPSRHLIVRAIIRARVMDRTESGENSGHPPHVQGWIQDILPNEIDVPASLGPLLQPLRPRPNEDRDPTVAPPRFAARITWGTRGEPWLESVRPLP